MGIDPRSIPHLRLAMAEQMMPRTIPNIVTNDASSSSKVHLLSCIDNGSSG